MSSACPICEKPAPEGAVEWICPCGAWVSCAYCGGEGAVDSGGVSPWDSPVFVPCPACSIGS